MKTEKRQIAGITIVPQNLAFLRLSHRKTPQKHYSGTEYSRISKLGSLQNYCITQFHADTDYTALHQ